MSHDSRKIQNPMDRRNSFFATCAAKKVGVHASRHRRHSRARTEGRHAVRAKRSDAKKIIRFHDAVKRANRWSEGWIRAVDAGTKCDPRLF